MYQIMLISVDFVFDASVSRNAYPVGFSLYVKIFIKQKLLKKAGNLTVNRAIIKMTGVLLIILQREGKNPPWFSTLKYKSDLNACNAMIDEIYWLSESF